MLRKMWQEYRDFIVIMLVSVIGVVGFLFVVLAMTGTFGPLRTDFPMPLDVCAGTQVNVMNQRNRISVDYVNQRGDTVYLVYKLYSSSAPDLQSKQVIDGDDCSQ